MALRGPALGLRFGFAARHPDLGVERGSLFLEHLGKFRQVVHPSWRGVWLAGIATAAAVLGNELVNLREVLLLPNLELVCGSGQLFCSRHFNSFHLRVRRLHRFFQ